MDADSLPRPGGGALRPNPPARSRRRAGEARASDEQEAETVDLIGTPHLGPFSGPYTAPMTWEDAIAHPSLQDLPFKIELDQYGRLLMSPVSRTHSRLQFKIGVLLEQHMGGEAFVELAIETRNGVRSADAAWMSQGLADETEGDRIMQRAPEICVEVQSPANTKAEMREKTALYFEAGAQEVWICDTEGHMRFFGLDGQRERSALAPAFPVHLSL